MTRLRSYAPMKRQSDKVKKGEPDFKAVYAEVDARSEGRCEVFEPGSAISLATGLAEYVSLRCKRRAVQHHHLFKPRRSNHTKQQIVHVCAPCHDRMEWPYKRGRLCFLGSLGDVFCFQTQYAASKFEARGQGA